MNEPPRILTDSVSLSDDVDPQKWSFPIAYKDKVAVTILVYSRILVRRIPSP